MEPFTPWSNAAEREKKELEKSPVMKLIKSGDPKRLWDDCLEHESFIRSNTAHGIYREIPETFMYSEISDISQFCEFERFKWVMFRDKIAAYPHDRFRLGKFLGQSIDICPTLVAILIKQNGQVLHRFTYQALTQDE